MDRIRLYFDPICPWCYQTSRWVRRLAELGEVEADWGVFSLELANAEGGDLSEEQRREKAHARSGPALRTVITVRDAAGSDGVDAFYRRIGERVHQRGEPLAELETVRAALSDVALDPGLADKAVNDEDTGQRVTDEHHGLVERTRSFGVPTIQVDGDEGPAIFGPVVTEPPEDTEAVELWRHVAWLARYPNFAELKRDRSAAPELESVRQMQRQAAEKG
jgi:protein-disulfide isomerase-like protein with CxxC motif